MVLYPDAKSTIVAEDTAIVVGNVCFYGATSSGESFIRGMAGERLNVRNSVRKVAVEGAAPRL
ncbi:hypothetical protein O9992_11965 [Vibrio lentus]|nr:hypothetical protein [Vibrio lentus]